MGKGATISTYTEVYVDEVLEELSDDDLREELARRGKEEAMSHSERTKWHMRTVRKLLSKKEPLIDQEWEELKYLLNTYILPRD